LDVAGAIFTYFFFYYLKNPLYLLISFRVYLVQEVQTGHKEQSTINNIIIRGPYGACVGIRGHIMCLRGRVDL